jgi:hypothetical protein
MAKPPEPLEEVLPQAAWVVDAEVTEVVKTGAAPPPPPQDPKMKEGATSRGHQAPSQTVKLKVKRVLRGENVKELVVEKPIAGYALKAGNHGPFLIDKYKVILGRYGPDSYNWKKIEDALKG